MVENNRWAASVAGSIVCRCCSPPDRCGLGMHSFDAFDWLTGNAETARVDARRVAIGVRISAGMPYPFFGLLWPIIAVAVMSFRSVSVGERAAPRRKRSRL
jgi:hypothetical protein